MQVVLAEVKMRYILLCKAVSLAEGPRSNSQHEEAGGNPLGTLCIAMLV